jgi:LacI family transcriptional regulator
MAVKLKDIAEYLNISVSTVSRVLTNKDRVNEETRKKVLKAFEEFQYQPNEIARSLKSRTTDEIS